MISAVLFPPDGGDVLTECRLLMPLCFYLVCLGSAHDRSRREGGGHHQRGAQSSKDEFIIRANNGFRVDPLHSGRLRTGGATALDNLNFKDSLDAP